MTSNKALFEHQKSIFKLVEKSVSNHRKSNQERRTAALYKRRLETLEGHYEEFKANHILILQEDDETMKAYLAENWMEKFEEMYIGACGEIETDLVALLPTHESSRRSSSNESVSHNPTGPSPINTHVNLPRISIPVFDGTYDEWSAFHSLYSSMIHENRTLSEIQKFHYLRSSLTGDAVKVIGELPLLAENYLEAYQLLCDRYENKRFLFHKHMKSFAAIPNIKSEDAASLNHLLNVCKECVCVMKSWGFNLKHYEPILVFYLSEKLPHDTREFWVQSSSQKKDIPTFKEISECIEIRIRTIEEMTPDRRPSERFLSNAPFQSTKKGNASHPNHSGNNKQPKSFHIKKQQLTKSASKFKCSICNGHHAIRLCPTFLGMSVADREQVIKNLKYCYNCFAYNHQIRQCQSTRTCGECNSRHHTLLHNPAIHCPKHEVTEPPLYISPNPSAPPSNENSTHVNLHVTPTASQSDVIDCEVLLATVIVYIKSFDGTIHHLRALLDSGSQATLITEQAARTLRLNRSPIRANITGLGETATETARNSVLLDIRSPIDATFTLTVEAFILSKLTSLLPTRQVPLRSWPHLEQIPLADPKYLSPAKIDILLGADVYAQILLNGLRKGAPGDPIAQETKLGWVICGPVNLAKSSPSTVCVSSFFVRSDIDTLIHRFFELESVPEQRILTPEEKWCEAFYAETHKRNAEGRFIVRLPFKTYIDNSAVLGKSRNAAVSHQLQLEKRFLRDPALKREYSAVILEYLQLGHMQPVVKTEEELCKNGNTDHPSYGCSYVPHHAVVKEDSSTTKLRVVFNAAMKTSNGKSLNDILVTGPPLQNDIIIVVLNWRFHYIAFCADIAKMYRQIQVTSADANFQRIVWRNQSHEPIRDYAITTVMFGNSSSPYLAIKTVHQLAFDERETYPLASSVVITDRFVDDIFSGGDNIRYASKLQTELIDMLKAGGFELRKWVSNSSELLSNISPEAREVKLPLALNENDTVKALGIYWRPSEDSLSFKLKFDPSSLPNTKRSILSLVARLYDPSGWIAPVIIIAKIFLKQLWQFNLDWDDLVPHDLVENWEKFIDGLSDLHHIKIPRWLHTCSTNISYQLHAYCDASSHAYAAAVYLRTVKADGSINVALLTAKTKVAPVKPITIPRLELCGAILLVKLLKHIRAGLHTKINDANIFAYTDSKIVLAWLHGDISRWKVFVANRISIILDTTSIKQWHHVSTDQNPADVATRGLYPKELATYKLWWQGPTTLLQPEAVPAIFNPTLDENEQQEIAAETNSRRIYTVIMSDAFVENFSSLNRLMRISALCSRFGFNAQQKNRLKRKTGPISTEEIQSWTQHWIKVIQTVSFSHALDHLRPRKKFLHWKQFLTLNPELDGEGILRVHGRLQGANLPISRKHPIILPARHHFTVLIIRQAHLITLHGGTQATLTMIRHKYWILNGRNTVRSEINKCITCFRHKPKPCQQLMGSLPSPRIQFSRAFTHTGVDYAGPINIRPSKGRGIAARKGYTCIFICLCTKAIHIEAVSDLTSQSFLAAFYRFVARRGYCSHIYSDNGTNFVGADKLLRRNKMDFMRTVQSEIIPSLVNLNITWHFIPPASPNFGGLWEAGVKSIKHHLKRVVGLSTLTFEELSTLLYQIEAVLNSRPLCPLTNDPDDLEPLTPGHFIIGEPLLSPPEPNLLDETISPLHRFDLIQKMKQGFAKQWKRDYMGRLQARPKWMRKERNVGVNDLVLIKNDQLPAIQWQLARVIEIHPGLDNLVRVLTLRTASGICKRPISKVCLLPECEPINTHNLTN